MDTMMKISRPLAGKDGFTMLETMIALGILAFGLLAVVGLFVYSVGGNTQGGRQTEAVSLAQQKLEEFKTTAYPNILNPTATELVQNTNISPSGDPDDPHKFYIRSWSVEENPALQVKTITVNVKWTSNGKDHVVTLATKRAYDR